jgi:hypothetical protein
MPPRAVLRPLRRASPSPVHPAHPPAAHSRGAARQAGALRPRAASRGGVGAVHGVGVMLLHHSFTYHKLDFELASKALAGINFCGQPF